MNFRRHLLIPIFLVLLVGSWMGCERVVPEKKFISGNESEVVESEKFIVLDTTKWSFKESLGSMAYFDTYPSNEGPKNGDILLYYSDSVTLFGRLVGTETFNGALGLELNPISLNDVFSFFSYRDTLRTIGNGYKENINPAFISIGDTLRLIDQIIDIRLEEVMVGSIEVGELSISESGNGEAHVYLLPEWEGDVYTHSLQLEWDQQIDIRGDFKFLTLTNDELSDSLWIRTRSYADQVNGFPVQVDVEDWLYFTWDLPNHNSISSFLNISGTSKAKSLYESGLGWAVESSSTFSSKESGIIGWNKIVSGTISYTFKTLVKPHFAGLNHLSLTKELNVQTKATANWPNWSVLGNLNYSTLLHSTSNSFSDLPNQDIQSEATSIVLYNQEGELENETPVPNFSINPGIGYTNTDFKLNASGTTDQEDSYASLEIRWDYDSDGIWDTQFSTTKVSTKSYLVANTYEITMEVRDTQGATASLKKSLIVHETTSAPIASFSISPETGSQTDFFTFDASGCYDSEDALSELEVRWDFENDGEWDTRFESTKAAVKVYDPGTYVIKLEVMDTDGLTGSTTRLLEVKQANIKPTAFFVVNPESGTTETRFDFDASGSSDVEDSIDELQVRWDWENDGQWDTEYRILKTITHQFTAANNYNVVLQVLDTEGFSNTFTRTITVSNPNTKPIADFTIDPARGTVTTKFGFDASISTDNEDELDQLEVRWDWNNDAIYDTEFSTVKKIYHQFAEAGDRVISVQVRDSGGLTDTKAYIVYVN